MMSLPPSNQFGKSGMGSQKISSEPPTSGPDTTDVKNLENNLKRVDSDLNDLIETIKKESGGNSKLLDALKKMEGELHNILISLKKEASPEKLMDELKKMEKDFKELTAKLSEKEKKLLEKEKFGEKQKAGKEKEIELDDKDKKILSMVQGEVAQVAQNFSQITTESVKGTELASMNTRAEVSKTVQLIHKMVQGIQVGTVGGVHFTNVELKKTAEVPSFFANANVTITPGADGKMTVHFTNLTAEQERAAIYAIQQHPELLLDLSERVPMNRLQVGNQVVTLPSAEGAREERGGGRGGREGGGEQGREREGREPR